MIDNEICCPHCYETYETSYEDTWIGGKQVDCYTEEKQIVTCDKCGKKFSIVGFVSWNYETEEVEE